MLSDYIVRGKNYGLKQMSEAHVAPEDLMNGATENLMAR